MQRSNYSVPKDSVIPKSFSNDTLTKRSGVMLVGHGTRDDVGTRQFFQLGECLAGCLNKADASDRTSDLPVQACLLEFQHPTIPEAWHSLVSLGVTHVHVAPLLLFAAGHAKQDIPDLVRKCQADSPGVTFDQTRPLSRHRAIIELVCRRIAESINQIDTPEYRTSLIMVGRGSHDPCAQADMRLLTEVVRVRFGFAEVHTSFYAMAQPNLTDVLDAVATSGRCDALIVHPHLLFAGRLYDAIERQTQEAAVRYPGVRMHLSHYLGPDPLVAQAIAGRIGGSR